MVESLAALQNWMHQALVFPGQASTAQAERYIDSSSRLNGGQHLAIYQRSYYLRLLKCMREQFPALCYALGESLFDDFAHEYLQTHPPESHTLYELGKHFPNYLEQTRPDQQTDQESWIDFMLELVQFERILFVMFDAPGNEGKVFADTDSDDKDLRLQPCFTVADYRFPVAWYYHQVRDSKNPEFPPEQRNYIALSRVNYLTYTHMLTAPQYLFLTAMKQGMRVSEGLDWVAKKTNQSCEDVYRSWTRGEGTRDRWIEAGFFITAA